MSLRAAYSWMASCTPCTWGRPVRSSFGRSCRVTSFHGRHSSVSERRRQPWRRAACIGGLRSLVACLQNRPSCATVFAEKPTQPQRDHCADGSDGREIASENTGLPRHCSEPRPMPVRRVLWRAPDHDHRSGDQRRGLGRSDAGGFRCGAHRVDPGPLRQWPNGETSRGLRPQRLLHRAHAPVDGKGLDPRLRLRGQHTGRSPGSLCAPSRPTGLSVIRCLGRRSGRRRTRERSCALSHR